MPLRLTSRRVRRRLMWLGVLAAVGGGVALAISYIPSTGDTFPTARSGGPTGKSGSVGVAANRQVPVTPADRRAINALLDRFVPLAVERKDPFAARAFVTPALRSQATLAEWRQGSLPGIYPYDAHGTTFHDWTVFLSFRNEVDLDLLLQPLHPDKTGAAVLRFYVKRLHGRWLIDASYPIQISPPQTATRASAKPATPARSKASKQRAKDILKPRLSAWWFIVPGAVIGIGILIPLLIFGYRWHQSRRKAREWQAQSMR